MKTYQFYLDSIGEYGVVKEVRHPIVSVIGLPRCKPNEMVVFETGEIGTVYAIGNDHTEVLVFSKTPIRIDTKVVRSDEFLSVPVGESLLGSMLNPLGELISTTKVFQMPTEMSELEREVDGISKRAKITKEFHTGVTVVDMMVPLGKGQRELIIGDKKTGKTAFLISTILNQIKEGTITIYAAIGKRRSEIKWLQEFFVKNGVADKIIIIGTSSDDSPSLIYLTPYTGMTIAEYFKDKGVDTLLILDDLSVHAKFYREIALIAKNFPGRDSYPGDIFFTHARLLERAGNFIHEKTGEVAITCLPIVEIVEGNFTDYIATNIMSMTDGHIFFDSNVFRNGRRPAVNIGISVTRVGRQTQSGLKKEFNRELSAFINNYEKMLELSRFGAELSPEVKEILKKGEKIYAFFNQNFVTIIPEEVQIIFLALIWLNVLDPVENSKLEEPLNALLLANQDPNINAVMRDLVNLHSLKDFLLHVLKRKEEFIALCKIKTA